MKLRPVPKPIRSQRGFFINPFSGSGGGTGWPVSPTNPSILADDANYKYVTSRLAFNGANASTAFYDSVGSEWFANGNAQLTTSSPKYGSACLLLDGSGDYAGAIIPSLIGTADLTVEAWINITSLASDGEIICCYDGTSGGFNGYNLVFEFKTTGALRGSLQTGSGGGVNVDITTATGLLTTGTWYHVAFVADGSTARLYIDGVQQQSGAITGTRANQHSTINVGRLNASVVTRYFNGKIDDLRVTAGICRYPSGTTFTPPASEMPAFAVLPILSSFTVAGTVNDSQGIASDSTDLWWSSSSVLWKLTEAGSVTATRSVTADNPTTKDQINGLYIKDGILYVSAFDYTAGVGTSWIVEYDPTTLTPNGTIHTLDISTMTEGVCEGLAFYKGFWWVVFHATQKIAVYTSDFATRVALLSTTFTITGSSGGVWFGARV